MIGTFLKCDRPNCRAEVAVKGRGDDLPQGWLQGYMPVEAFGSPQAVHFCSPNCAYLHDYTVTKEEKDAGLEVAATEEVAA